MASRRLFKQTESLQRRLIAEATSLREQAKLLAPGAVRDALLRKARQTETASQINAWLNSPGLQAPR